MKLTVLGNRSPYPTAQAGGVGYLLQTEEQNILLEVGPGTLSNLNQLIEYHQLDAVIISHLHADHFLELIPLHYALMLAQKRKTRQEALAVYLPFTACSELDFIRSKVGKEFHLQQITADTRLQLGEVEFTFQQSNHSKECYGIRISDGEKVIGYTADTAWDQNLISFLSGTDILVAEASLLDKDREERKVGHMTVKEAVDFGAKAETKELLLTHLGSIYKLEEIKNEIPELEIEVKVSQVGENYNLD
ncbi:MBL fold metallo-hydrolase [Halanaerocella petrolearia]